MRVEVKSPRKILNTSAYLIILFSLYIKLSRISLRSVKQLYARNKMRLFNQQRKLLLLKKKFRKYLIYAIGEIILIVVGIMLALQLNNWNKSSENNHKENTLLVKLQQEFSGNQQNLLESINHLNIVKSELTVFLSLMGPNPKVVDENRIHNYVAIYYWNPGYGPNKVVFDVAISTGEINLIKNKLLQEKLRTWSALIKTKEDMESSIINQQQTYSKSWTNYHPWKSAIKQTGEMEDIGPSNFPFDQNRFLSTLELENAVSMKIILMNMHRKLLLQISDLQLEIISMLPVVKEDI